MKPNSELNPADKDSAGIFEKFNMNSAPNGLLFWNRLGNEAQTANSIIGPDTIYKSGGRFATGVFGGAFFADAQEDARIQVPKRGAINGSSGTIEFWGRLDGFPATIGADYRPFFILDETENPDYFHAAIGFGENNGIGGGGLVGRVAGHGTGSGEFGYWEYDDVLPDGGENWHHYALVWDADGVDTIAGDRQVALFVDGKLASAQWATYLPQDLHTTQIDDTVLSLLYNSGADGVAAMDNLKIWDHAKTNFADRFVEGFTRVGTPGADLLTGSVAGDDLRGLGGADRIVGRAGDDLLLGGCGSDILCGGKGDDVLGGGRGDDRLMGGAGADVLRDGDGRDRLAGGMGGDVFKLAWDKRLDRILDFSAHDRIDLSAWGVRYDDLHIADGGEGKVIVTGAGDSILVAGSEGANFGAEDLDASKFIYDDDSPTPGLIGYAETLGGFALSIEVSEGFAYVGEFQSYSPWFHVFDVSDPTHPTLRGTYDAGQEVQDIDVIGDRAYLSNDANGVVELDISDPDHPTFVGSTRDGSYAGNLAYDGSQYGYVSYWYTDGGEVAVYDLNAFPQSAVTRYDAARDRHVSNLAISEDRLYLLAGEEWRFEIVDISEPTAPEHLSELILPESQYSGVGEFEVVENFAFMAREETPSGDGGLLVLDLRNETAPEVAAFLRVSDVGGIPYRAIGLDVEGDRAFMASKTGLYIFDISDPFAPSILVDPHIDAAFRFPEAYLPSKGGYVQVVDDLAYVTAYADIDSPETRSGGLAIFQLPPEHVLL